MRSLLFKWEYYLALFALGLAGCNSESGGGDSSIQTEPFFCAGGVCSLARGVALNEEYAATVQDELALGNVILKAANGSRLVLDNGIEWDGSHSLTLQADNDIRINGGLSATSGKLIVDNPGHDFILVRPVHLSAGDNLRINGEEYVVITELGAEGSVTGTDLQGINGAAGVNFALGSDIDADTTKNWSATSGFKRISQRIRNFEGLGHTISQLQVNGGGTQSGMFASLSDATIRHLALVNQRIDRGSHVGGLAAETYGTITLKRSCFIGGRVSADYDAGGFFGRVDESLSISDSCVMGTTINALEDTDVAGFAADVSGRASINKSYALQLWFTGNGNEEDAFAIPNGVNDSVNIAKSLFKIFSSATAIVTRPGSVKLSEAEMSQLQHYMNAGWDISTDPDGNSLWYLDETSDTPPMLRLFDVELSNHLPSDA
ncbi:hypothetical protein ABMA57_01700 [Saccharospirillum sp. HFRX-1]|uniref:hypothetical protein n=1 Tax=unclassified Saccharospirillum TaxID=2633430 RepID=UPI0037154BC5